MELINAEDYYRAVDIDNVKGETLPAGRELNDSEITSLLDVCASDFSMAGARDAAIIALMFSCGLRRAEVVNLDLKDYDPVSGKIKVMGKRHKERTAYLVNEAALAMMDWIRIRGNLEGPLLLPLINFQNPQNSYPRSKLLGITELLPLRVRILVRQ